MHNNITDSVVTDNVLSVLSCYMLVCYFCFRADGQI